MDDLLNSELFTVTSLTKAINEANYQPRRLGELGLFEEDGISTTSFRIEKDGDTLQLVESRERGASGQVITPTKREVLTFGTVHLPTRATIKADEVQGVRAFGSATNLASIEALRNKRLSKAAQNLEVTHEHLRMGAIKGKVVDADGKTIIADLFKAFGITQNQVVFDFGKNTGSKDEPGTYVQERCLDVMELIEKAMGDGVFSGARAFVGENFWRKLVFHPSVAETYRYQLAERLQGDARQQLDFGGIIWERYRGGVGGQPFIGADEAYVEPMGTLDKLLSYYAPADYMDTVNTIGLPFYSSAEPLPHNKGIDLEAQSNPFHLNAKPAATIKLVAK
ncbi:major capsid protein [Carnimonas bestiolae]|uniref:major capsid protein n=1 Tax=Carnimonas bestiolae TaxID=3402172 RepID=UPI003EDC95B5